jgi:hypothetical protein
MFRSVLLEGPPGANAFSANAVGLRDLHQGFMRAVRVQPMQLSNTLKSERFKARSDRPASCKPQPLPMLYRLMSAA